jgi:hypothetical protein
MKHNMIRINFDKHSSRHSLRRSNYYHAEKYNLRYEVLQKTCNHESIDDELIN